MSAMSPPVLVPQIRSNTSQGQSAGSSGWSRRHCRLTCAMRSFNIYKEEMPRTPPPSSDRIRNGSWVPMSCVCSLEGADRETSILRVLWRGEVCRVTQVTKGGMDIGFSVGVAENEGAYMIATLISTFPR